MIDCCSFAWVAVATLRSPSCCSLGKGNTHHGRGGPASSQFPGTAYWAEGWSSALLIGTGKLAVGPAPLGGSGNRLPLLSIPSPQLHVFSVPSCRCGSVEWSVLFDSRLRQAWGRLVCGGMRIFRVGKGRRFSLLGERIQKGREFQTN